MSSSAAYKLKGIPPTTQLRQDPVTGLSESYVNRDKAMVLRNKHAAAAWKTAAEKKMLSDDSPLTPDYVPTSVSQYLRRDPIGDFQVEVSMRQFDHNYANRRLRVEADLDRILQASLGAACHQEVDAIATLLGNKIKQDIVKHYYYWVGSSATTATTSTYSVTTTNSNWYADPWDDTLNAIPHDRPTRRAIQMVHPDSVDPAAEARSNILELLPRAGLVTLKESTPLHIKTPDGTVIRYDGGKIAVDDANAKTTYRANRIREFNKYLNASDLMEEFILFLGELGVKQSEIMDVPVDVFVHWLIMRAAMEDKEDSPVDPASHPAVQAQIAPPRAIHGDRCLCCNRFISRARADTGVNFCSEEHMLIFVQRKGVFNAVPSVPGHGLRGGVSRRALVRG